MVCEGFQEEMKLASAEQIRSGVSKTLNMYMVLLDFEKSSHGGCGWCKKKGVQKPWNFRGDLRIEKNAKTAIKNTGWTKPNNYSLRRRPTSCRIKPIPDSRFLAILVADRRDRMSFYPYSRCPGGLHRGNGLLSSFPKPPQGKLLTFQRPSKAIVLGKTSIKKCVG